MGKALTAEAELGKAADSVGPLKVVLLPVERAAASFPSPWNRLGR